MSTRKTSNQTPRKASDKTPFPIVGVGASAGGLEAFTQLLRNLPEDTGMAFVLVQHLDPAHSSSLAQILSKTTALPVREVTDKLPVKPNKIYIIPPNAMLSVEGGVLRLRPRRENLGAARSIDAFFESLAQDQRELAIGVILSGAASDGAMGLEAIKAEGGITFAQDETAAYNSMPRSAVAAGCVDFILSPEKIARELTRISKHPLLHAGGPPGRSRQEEKEEEATALEARPGDGYRKIVAQLRRHTGVDFSLYKSTTILRRINRRMVLNKLVSVDDYARFLRHNNRELDSLYSDVLINVTGFFRNPDAYQVLCDAVLPKLVGEPRDGPVRFWVLGCSTGQEAYSLAMVYAEYCDRVQHPPQLQIFATDLNDALLDKARAGFYAKAAVNGVSPERLRRFFVEQDGGFYVTKALRDVIVFARQNLLNDPPFSRMDLITCRNLLIYIEPSLQKKMMPMFHYALKPRGYLFLGASESVGPFTDLFALVNKKHKIYCKRSGPSPALQLRSPHDGGSAKKHVAAPELAAITPAFSLELNAQREADRVTRNRYAPPGVLVDAQFQVLQFRGDTSQFLKPASGQASFNVLKMAREGLRIPLRSALQKVRKKNQTVRTEHLRVKQDGHAVTISLEVAPLKNLREHYYLISFETETPGSHPAKPPQKQPEAHGATAGRPASEAARQRIAELEDQLEEVRDHLQSLQEQSEAANEELQASNEEITSANEELQSLNEELETSKEELQAANEELTTLNGEMSNRNADLTRLNSDLNNLHSSTRLPILVLGRELQVRSFSTQAAKQLNLMASDIGRPIGQIRHELEVPDLEAFLTEVIQNVREGEREVRDRQGRWHLLRARPYLTVDNKLDGAVLVLVDIDALKLTQQDLIAARDHAADTVDTVREPLVVLDSRLRVQSANRAFYRYFRCTAGDTVGKVIYELGGRQWDIPELRKLIEEILPKDRTMENFELELDLQALGRRTLLLNARRFQDPTWAKDRILLAIEDVTDQRQAGKDLERARVAEAILATARDPLLILDSAFCIHSANAAFYRTFLLAKSETEGQPVFDLLDGQWRIPQLRSLLENVVPRNSFFDNLEVTFTMADGARRTFLLDGRKLKDEGDRILLGIQDITELLHFQAEVRQSEARNQAILKSAMDAIITIDGQGAIVEFNPAAEKMFGYLQHEAVGKSMAELNIPERIRQDYVASLAPCLATGQGPMLNRQIELKALRADGTEFPAELCLVAIRGAQPALFTAFVRDISQRKRAEEVLADQAKLLDWSNDAMMVRDPEGRITFWNHGAEKLYGWSRAEALGRRSDELLHTQFPRPLQDILEETNRNGYCAAETIQTKKGGGQLTVLSRWTLIRDKAAGLILKCDTDITERKKTEEALREAQKLLSDRAGTLEQIVKERTGELQENINELEHFSYTISHDMRTPLRAMQGFAELLINESSKRLTPEGVDYLRRIRNGAQRMDALILDALQYTKILHGEIPLSAIEPAVVLQGIFTCYPEFQMPRADIRIEGQIPAIIANESGLGQCFSNFLSNGVKFVQPGTTPRIRIRGETRGNMVRLWFEDNGIGIAPEYHERIFGMFQQLDKNYEGTGIGLALVRKVASRMDGAVGVESEPGKGSRFWLELKKA